MPPGSWRGRVDQQQQPIQATLGGHGHLVIHSRPAFKLRQQVVGVGELGYPSRTDHRRDTDVLDAGIEEPLDQPQVHVRRNERLVDVLPPIPGAFLPEANRRGK